VISIVVKGTVGKRGVGIAVAAPEHGPLQPLYATGPLTLAPKTASTLVRVGESKAPSRTAMLTITVTRQKINLVVGVK